MEFWLDHSLVEELVAKTVEQKEKSLVLLTVAYLAGVKGVEMVVSSERNLVETMVDGLETCSVVMTETY